MRALQRLRGREQLVEVGHLSGLVAPCVTDRTVAGDQEGRSLGDVLHPVVLVPDSEPPDRVSIPVRDERHVEVERL